MEGFLNQELSVQNNQFGTDRDQVIAFVVFEELHEDEMPSIFS
jgi:hypothetical protein